MRYVQKDITVKTKSSDGLFGIEAASQQSGLSQHLIRMWERRYHAVRPTRTETNRRLYSAADIYRLTLLQRAQDFGHRIGDIASLPTSQLEEYTNVRFEEKKKGLPKSSRNSAHFLAESLEAIQALDDVRLNAILLESSVRLGQMPLLEQFIVPLLEEIGRLWRSNELRIVQEHLASTVIRNFLGSVLMKIQPPPGAPILLTATATGQHHELGAMIAAAITSQEGWRAIHLGANLSAMEIAQAVNVLKARAVALSFVFPTVDPRAENEIEQLKSLIPQDVTIFVGGRAAGNYETKDGTREVVGIRNFSQLRTRLAAMISETQP